MDAYRIRSLLQEQVESVVQYLLPQGKRTGASWRVGSVGGEPGHSLDICLTGVKRGVWMDGKEKGKQGGILDLWMAVRNLSFHEALKDAAKWLQLPDQSTDHRPVREYKKPVDDAKPFSFASEVKRYLTEDRKLSPAILKEMQIGEKLGKIVFRYFDEQGELAMVKYLDLKRENGKKVVSVSPGCRKILYGMDTELVKSSHGILLICEGEMDAATWQQWGIPAVSVPFGAKTDSANDEWISNCYQWLQQFHTIYLSMDMTPDGQEAAISIMKRLGRERCLFVSLPFKDANECLQNGVFLGKIFLDEARPKDPDDIVTGLQLANAVWDHMQKGPEDEQGIRPFDWKDLEFRIRTGEATMLGGDPNAGKSTLAYLILAWLAAVKGEGCFIGSYESPANSIVARMVTQIAGRHLNAIGDYQAYHEIKQQVMDRIVVHKYQGKADPKKFLEYASYAVKRYGVKHILLDSITCTNTNLDDKEAVAMMMGDFQGFWKSHDVHFWIVVHFRKGNDPDRVKGGSDILGSVVQWALIDNILIPYKDNYGCKLKVAKQRLGGEKDPIKVYFHKPSLRLMENADDLPLPWVTKSEPQPF